MHISNHILSMPVFPWPRYVGNRMSNRIKPIVPNGLFRQAICEIHVMGELQDKGFIKATIN